MTPSKTVFEFSQTREMLDMPIIYGAFEAAESKVVDLIQYRQELGELLAITYYAASADRLCDWLDSNGIVDLEAAIFTLMSEATRINYRYQLGLSTTDFILKLRQSTLKAIGALHVSAAKHFQSNNEV